MVNFKYGDKGYKHFLGVAKNCEDYGFGFERQLWIDLFEDMKEMIVNTKVVSKNQKVYEEKCAKLTIEMGYLIKAQQVLTTFEHEIHLIRKY